MSQSNCIFGSKVIVVLRARRKWRDDIGASYTMMTSNFSDVNDKIAVVFYCFNFFFCQFVKMALVILNHRWRWRYDVIESVLMTRIELKLT